jgi:hypothetical protein
MKIFKLILFAALFIILAIPAYSQELKAMIYVSNQAETFEQNRIVREYIVEETAYCAFFVQGFSIDSTGAANLTADIKFIDPDGNILVEENNFAQYQSIVPKSQNIIALNNAFDITFEKTDPLGMYKLNVKILDKIANTKDESETTLLLFDTQKSKELIVSPIRDAKRLDELWVEYFRSKNPWAVKRIISALRLRKESPRLEDALIAEAAKWSLESNAKEHPEVLSICKQSLEYAKGATKELLQEIINNVENKN